MSRRSHQAVNFNRTEKAAFSHQAMASSQDTVDAAALEKKFAKARQALLSLQQADGHWCFPLQADCTIPAEYMLMMHFMDEVDVNLESRMANYLRDHQDLKHGGWPLYFGGHFDLSCTVKAYYALKLAGDSPDAMHMVAARNAILAHGGAARANVFTRILLAMFEQIPMARRAGCSSRAYFIT